MAKLTAAARNALPARDFALPKERKYPIENRSHAANAESRASGKPVAATVDAAVHRRYPDLGNKRPGPEHAKKLAGTLRG